MDFSTEVKYSFIPQRTYSPEALSSESHTTTDNKYAKNIDSREIAPNVYILSVFDVAAYILKKAGPMTTMKLHKLLYYCQAWSLVWDDSPLYKEHIEAWANGPVIRSLFSFHRGLYQINSINVGNGDLLTEKQKETVNSVLHFYGDKTTQWLIDLTHLELPWKEARKGLKPSERGENIIELNSMFDYYSSLSNG